MEKTGTIRQGLTRGDKAHKKIMDKLEIVKESVIRGMDSFSTIHKQTIDASREYFEAVSKSQEEERACWHEKIKTSDDPKEIEIACNRLRELDKDKYEKTNEHDEKMLQSEADKTRKNIAGAIVVLVSITGLATNKKIRHVARTVLTERKNLLR